MVQLVLGHLGQVHPHFRVVRCREGVFALIVTVGVIEVPRHDHLPCDLHRVTVDSGEDVDVFLGLIQNLAVVDQRRFVFTVRKDVTGARVFLRTQTVDVMRVRDLDDLVAFHHVTAHTCHAGVGLIVHEQIAAVIGAIREGHVRVVKVAVVISDLAVRRQKLLGFRQQAFGQNLQRFIGLPPASGRAAVEDRDAHQFAH